MRSRAVQKRVRQLAADLALPDPFDVSELCRAVSARRNRAIVLAPLPVAPVGTCGLWLATASMDVICYEENTSALHQQHIVLHELGHILCGHGEGETLDRALAALFPQLSADTLRIMLARQHQGYLTDQELDAELFAYTVLARAGSHNPERQLGQDDESNQWIRLIRMLEGDR